MFDYEGSRSEFLKILAEMGEEPAFIARARAPQIALEGLLDRCTQKRDEMLKWPRLHFTVLFHRIAGDWTRLDPYVVGNNTESLFTSLATQLKISDAAKPVILATDRGVLRDFVESGGRFNRAWRRFLDDVGLADVNRLREEYNQFYPMEKACAFGTDAINNGFTTLPALEVEFLLNRFPLLSLPVLR